MTEESGEKKYKPSQKKLDNLKKEGNFLRAKELFSGTTLLVAIIMLVVESKQFYAFTADNFQTIYSRIGTVSPENYLTNEFINQLLIKSFLLLAPIFLCMIVVFLLIVLIYGKGGYSTSLLHFKASRLSPASNLKRIFSMQNVVEILKSILKIILFLSIFIVFSYCYQNDILSIASITQPKLLTHCLLLIRTYLWYLCFGIILLAVLDAIISMYQYNKKAMMTYQEMKDEQKESDGNPEIKRKIRQAQQSIAYQKLKQDIPNATVIITNPTHFAVALRYQEQVDSAPVIIGKGIDHMALHIRTLAVKHSIPIYDAPELARAIYYTGQVGIPIRPELYMAVALVFSYILQLKDYQLGRAALPTRTDNLPIPDDFKFAKLD